MAFSKAELDALMEREQRRQKRLQARRGSLASKIQSGTAPKPPKNKWVR